MTGAARAIRLRMAKAWWALVLCALVVAVAGPLHPAQSSTTSAGLPVHTLRVLALGDSVTAGTSCDCAAFPVLYTRELAARTSDSVRLSNQGTPGATSADVLAYLKSQGGIQSAREADIVLLTIGANDFSTLAPQILSQTCGGSDDLDCTRPSMTQLRTQLSGITERLHDLRDGQPTTVLITDYWNVFEDGDVAEADYTPQGRAASDRLTQLVNDLVEGAADQGAATFVDLYRPFKGHTGDENPTSLLADDGDHPNAAGHEVIAEALLAAGLGPLTPPPR